MTDVTADADRRARVLGLLAVAIAVTEAVIAAFLVLMSTVTTADTGASLLLGAVLAAAGLVAVLLVRQRTRSGGAARVAGPVWVCRLLPLAGVAVAVPLAAAGVVSWLAVALGFFAPAPATVLGMVAPDLVRDGRSGGRSAG